MFIFDYFALRDSNFPNAFIAWEHSPSRTMQSSRSSYFYWLRSSAESERTKKNSSERNSIVVTECALFLRVRSFIPATFCSGVRTGRTTRTMEPMNETQMHWQSAKQQQRKQNKKTAMKKKVRLDWSDSGCRHWRYGDSSSSSKENGLFEAERGQMSMFLAAHGKLLCTDEIGDEWKQQHRQQPHEVRNEERVTHSRV